jgi:hypothetical protein
MAYCDDCDYAASKGEPVFADCPNCAPAVDAASVGEKVKESYVGDCKACSARVVDCCDQCERCVDCCICYGECHPLSNRPSVQADAAAKGQQATEAQD